MRRFKSLIEMFQANPPATNEERAQFNKQARENEEKRKAALTPEERAQEEADMKFAREFLGQVDKSIRTKKKPNRK